ncbi:MAG: hypothetical protein RR216_04320, partial [Pseudoflavonifractor sp.]
APVTEPTKAPVTEPTKAPVTEPTKAPVTEPTKAPVTEPTKAPVTEPTKAPLPSATPSPEPMLVPFAAAAPGWDGAGRVYTPTTIENGGFEFNRGDPWRSDLGGLEINPPSTYFTGNRVAADGGSWIAEICGDMGAKTIYQDIATVPGEVIHWSVAHRSRTYAAEGDQMKVIFGRTADGFANGVAQLLCTARPSEENQWVVNEGDYVVPLAQTSTRFYFQAVRPSTSGSGNLIDDVQFKTLLSAPYVSADGGGVKVRIYCTLPSAPTMYFQVGEGHNAGAAFTVTKDGDYLEGTIPLNDVPGGTEKITVWAGGYAEYAQTVTLPAPTACYVISTGDDGGNGSSEHPFKTLQKAYDSIPAAGGEIRLLGSAGTADVGTLVCAADKNVAVSSYLRFTDGVVKKGTGDPTDVTNHTADSTGAWVITRDAALKTTLVNVGKGSLTLDHIVLDGNQSAVTDATGALAEAQAAGATL